MMKEKVTNKTTGETLEAESLKYIVDSLVFDDWGKTDKLVYRKQDVTKAQLVKLRYTSNH